ncbi:MAG TPA: DUF1080 domain-containing protein [Chthoniobacteraceae bacterium]|jgi:hypothetical protein|nr:DUF1080 domain-containing protein [Chthoniobacteraceae bacterium]
MFPRLCASALLAAVLVAPVRAADNGPVFTDPAAAGPDFEIQGEWIGDVGAVQVVALGEGKFRLVGWSESLPGISPTTERRTEIDARREGERVVFETGTVQGWIAGGELKATHNEGGAWSFKRTERKSPTLGAKPPAGAVVLFDGTNADAWQGGKVDANGWLNAGVKSKQSFGDGTLHVEFRTPFQPSARGQGRGNSGVYLQDRYEVQVLDSFGLKGENNECGGIYTIAAPRVNMCFPPLSWQTYDIDFESARFGSDNVKTANARMTVRHNGVLIHDRVEVPKTTTSAGRPEGPETGPIQLQNHGNPVVYRNIWFVEKAK